MKPAALAWATSKGEMPEGKGPCQSGRVFRFFGLPAGSLQCDKRKVGLAAGARLNESHR